MKSPLRILLLMLALQAPAYADMPWDTRADAAPGSPLAVPEVLRWCLPAAESALPIVNAVSAQDMVLQMKQRFDAAWTVAPSKAMTDAQWDTFIANVAWAKAKAEAFSLALANQPAQTLKQFTDACTSGDPALQAKLDQALADLATARAALTKANADLSAAKAQITQLTTERDALKAQVLRLQAELAAAVKARDEATARADTAEAQAAQSKTALAVMTAERDALARELEQIPEWRQWLPKLRELLSAAPAE